MKRLVVAAFVAHVGGTLLMIFANSFADKFAVLYAGALAISIGDGLLQSVLYPLVATIYPDRKTEMFNKLLLWFPGGMVLGGLVLFAINSFAAWVCRRHWRGSNMAVETVCCSCRPSPTACCSWGRPFRHRARASGDFLRADVSRDLRAAVVWLLLACMMMPLQWNSGPNAWVPPSWRRRNCPALILGWTSLLAAVMRYFAGALVASRPGHCRIAA